LQKRGGDALYRPLDGVLLMTQARDIDVLALDEALDAPTRIDDRKSRVVELRYVGGLKIDETTQVLGLSLDTAKRDWRMARAWLVAELGGKILRPVTGGEVREQDHGTADNGLPVVQEGATPLEVALVQQNRRKLRSRSDRAADRRQRCDCDKPERNSCGPKPFKT
jgi:hypothetical protein